jgi:Tfp pilus assembly protein PilF
MSFIKSTLLSVSVCAFTVANLYSFSFSALAQAPDLTGFEMAAPVSDSPLANGASDLNLEIVSSHDLLTTGMQDVEGNRLDLAVRKFQEILRREPGNVSAHNNLAVCLKRQGNKEEAIEEFRKALANNPSRPELYNNLASSLIAVGRYDEALTALYQALRLQPDFAEAHRNLGHVLSSKGDNDGAVTAYQQAIQESLNNPNDIRLSDLHFDLGDCLRSIHRYEQALIEYRAADKLGVSAWRSLSSIGCFAHR